MPGTRHHALVTLVSDADYQLPKKLQERSAVILADTCID